MVFRPLSLLVLLALASPLPAPAPQAQAQGQVQVHVRVPEASATQVPPERVKAVQGFMDAGIKRLRVQFPGTPSRSIRVYIHADAAAMPSAIREHLSPRSPGLALLSRDEIHLVLDHLQYNPPGDLRTVVEHELVHVLLDQHVGKAGPHVPRWFHEGLAQALAENLYLGMSEERIVFRLKARTHIPFRKLEKGFPHDDEGALRLAYGLSFSYVSYLLDELGLDTLLATARLCSRDKDFSAAFVDVTDEAIVVYEEKWTEYVTHGSGAAYRVIRDNCFLLVLVAGLPLLAFALSRRLRRDRVYRERLAEEDTEEDAAEEEEAAPEDESEPDREPDHDTDHDADYDDHDEGPEEDIRQ